MLECKDAEYFTKDIDAPVTAHQAMIIFNNYSCFINIGVKS